jgi:CHAT domain-containing protein
MLVTHDDVRAVAIARARSHVRPMVAEVRQSIEAGLAGGGEALAEFDLGAAHALYTMLFPEPLRPGAGIERLYVATSDALAQLPFDVLVTREPVPGARLADAAWLLRDMAIEVPVTLAAIGSETDAASTRRSFAGIGAPALGGPADAPIQLAGLFRNGSVDVEAVRDLPPLPAAAHELESMRRALGDGEAPLLIGAAATESAVKAMDLSRYGVLAFATHGLLADELDGLTEPALVLTPPDTPREGDDGLLSAGEIAGLDLTAELVVLSACNTAAGATQAAPPYTGLAQAFLSAGAKSLLLSHWRVRDDAAARLSVATVEGNARGWTRAEALRRAKLAMIADPSVPGGAHPAIWAPFILIGR